MQTGHFTTLQWLKPEWAPTPAEQANPVAMAMRAVGIPRAPGVDGQSPAMEARYLLRAAAEIEHGLLVQYLYAGYSAKDETIQGNLIKIAKEEMGHLICVQNMLLALGRGPFFDRQDFNASPDPGFPAPYPFVLAPLSKSQVADFVIAESPLRAMLEADDGFTPAEKEANKEALAAIDSVAGSTTLNPQSIHQVGGLYAALFWLFKADDKAPPAGQWDHYPTQLVLNLQQQAGRTSWHLGDGDIVPEAAVKDVLAQSDNEDWNPSEDERIFVRGDLYKDGKPDRDSICQILGDIAAQGEGWLSQKDSHFQQFFALFLQFTGANPPVAWNVPTGPVTTPPAGTPSAGIIDDAESVLWAKLFNVRYWITLMKLSLALASPRSQDSGPPAGRAALIKDVIRTEMPGKLGVLGKDLVQMRRRPGSPSGPEGEKAAPPFELPPSKALPDLVSAQWQALRDWLTLSKDLIAQIKKQDKDPANPTPREHLDKITKGDDKLLAAIPTTGPT